MLNNGLYIYIKEEEKVKKRVGQGGAEYLLIKRNIQSNKNDKLDHFLFDDFIEAHIRIDKLYLSNEKYQNNSANLSAVHYSEYYKSHVLHYYFDLDGNHLKSTCKLQGEDPSIIVLTDEQSKQFEENAQWAISYIQKLKDNRSEYVKRLLDDDKDIDSCITRYFENDNEQSKIKNELGHYLKKLNKLDLYMTGELSSRYKFLKNAHLKMCDFEKRTLHNQSALASFDSASYHADEQDNDTCDESKEETDNSNKTINNDKQIINKCEEIIRRIDSLDNDSHKQLPKENRHNLYQDLFLARFELEHIATQKVIKLKKKIEGKIAHYKNPIDESLELIRKGDVDKLRGNIVFLPHFFPYKVCAMLDKVQINSEEMDTNVSKAIDCLLESTENHDVWKHYMIHVTTIEEIIDGEMRFLSFKERLLRFALHEVFLVFTKYFPSLGTVVGVGHDFGIISVMLSRIGQKNMPFNDLVRYLEYEGVTSLEKFFGAKEIKCFDTTNQKALEAYYANKAHPKKLRRPNKRLRARSKKHKDFRIKMEKQIKSKRSIFYIAKQNMFSGMLFQDIVPTTDEFYTLYIRNTGVAETILHICQGLSQNKHSFARNERNLQYAFLLLDEPRIIIGKGGNLDLSDIEHAVSASQMRKDSQFYFNIKISYIDSGDSKPKLLQGMFNALEKQFKNVNVHKKALAYLNNFSKKVKVVDKATKELKMRIILAKIILVTLNAKINRPKTYQERLANLKQVILINHELFQEMKGSNSRGDWQMFFGDVLAKESFEKGFERVKGDTKKLHYSYNVLKIRLNTRAWEIDRLCRGKFGIFSTTPCKDKDKDKDKDEAINKVIAYEFDKFGIKSF